MAPEPARGTRGGDAERSLCRDDATLVLIRHCRYMRRQEMGHRLITLMLLLSCAAFFLCFIFSASWTRQSSGEQASTDEQRAAYSKQESQCRSEPTPTKTTIQRFHMDLRSLKDKKTDNAESKRMKWEVAFSNMRQQYHNDSIVIPEAGAYFIYVRFQLTCHKHNSSQFNPLYVWLNTWNDAYGKPLTIMDLKDGLACFKDEQNHSTEGLRAVFVGQLFNLNKEDQVSVTVKGYDMVTKAYFGAYLT